MAEIITKPLPIDAQISVDILEFKQKLEYLVPDEFDDVNDLGLNELLSWWFKLLEEKLETDSRLTSPAGLSVSRAATGLAIKYKLERVKLELDE